MNQDLEAFVRASSPAFTAWLKREHDEAIRFMATGTGETLYRAQGKYQLLEKMQQLVEKAKNL